MDSRHKQKVSREHAFVSLPGVVINTIFVGFICAGLFLVYTTFFSNDAVTLSRMRKNEMAAYDHLKEIFTAQDVYYEKSPEIVGRNLYAVFLTHLWKAVDLEGRPVNLNLIPESLAVAVGTTKIVDGYYFIDVRQRRIPGKQAPVTIDYTKAWTVAAIPQKPGQSGSFVLMIDQTGALSAIPVDKYASRYPLHPETGGWTLLPTKETLAELQEKGS
nr:hypothetical protein [uncultured Desulfobacter sp.]